MYGNGYSMAIVFDLSCRSTPLTETKMAIAKAQPNWDLLRTVTFPSICMCVCNQGACMDNLVDVVDSLLICQNF